MEPIEHPSAPSRAAAENGRARIVVAGGFLGAGKTTALARLGAWLRGRNTPVRVIIGAAGGDSVDAIRFCEQGFDTQVARGAFLASPRLAEMVEPPSDSVFLIEPPGSAANLPGALEILRQSGHSLAPLTAVVDAEQALKMLRLDGSSRFSAPVGQLYESQIREASILLLHGAGDLAPRKLSALRTALERINPAPVLVAGARNEAWEEQWWRLLEQNDAAPSMLPESDSAMAAEADRALAALNCVVKLSSVRYFDGNKTLLEIAALVQTLLQQEAVAIAHLKAVLSSIDFPGEHALASAAGNTAAPHLAHALGEPIQLGRMILNLRAEGDPEILHSAVNRALFAVVERSPELFARMEHSEHFRPEAALLAR